ncbi:MAG TPA: hypothetical protein EYG92_11510 [Lutibacter sp.]|nr:hypothetical protein [Lutibacter sp.]
MDIRLSDESFYSQEFPIDIFILFNKIDRIKTNGTIQCDGNLDFILIVIDENLKEIKISSKYSDIPLDLESILTDRLYQKYKNSNIFFNLEGEIIENLDLNTIETDGIFYSPNQEIYLIKKLNKYILQKDILVSVTTEDGYIKFKLKHKLLKISFYLADFANNKLLLILLSEKLHLKQNDLLKNRFREKICGGG